MRVLMLGEGWFPSQLGGLNRYYRELLEQLPEARGVVIGPSEDAGDRVRAVSHHSSSLAARVLAFARAAQREGLDADVIDAHFALYAFLPIVLSFSRRKAILVHFQGPWADESVAANDASRCRRYARRRLERAVYSRANLVITLTGAFRRVLIERYGVSPWKTTVIPPGVDLDQFTPGDRSVARARYRLTPEAFVVCCARRLVPRMGLGVLIEAWKQLVVELPEAQLLIAGDGQLRAILEREIAASSISDSVTVLGQVAEKDLVALYRASDVNVVPSVFLEGFGLVVLEAAACGTPSIVSDVGGLPEAIANLGRGLIVPAADSQALASRLVLAARGELPAREQTRAWAEGFAWKCVADMHRDLFVHATSGGRNIPRKLRVAYVDHTAQLSGGELALFRLVRALDDVMPHVVLAEEGPLVDRFLRAGISVEVLPMHERTRRLRKHKVDLRRLPLYAMFDTGAYAFKLMRRLRELQPDVVHTNSLKSGIYGSIAARVAGVPAIWHVHDRIDTDYLPKLAVALVRALTRRVPDLVISNSQATRRTLSSRTPSRIIPSLAQLSPLNYDRARSGLDRPLVIGIVGRLAPWKGQDIFLRAFAEAFPSGEERARIVGAPLFGQEELTYSARLKTLVRELGVSSRVEFRGHRDNIVEEFREIDILVHASTVPEPFGQVVIEGMSAGLPVVASRGGGPEEIVTDGVNGLLYPPGDITALVELLLRLSGDPDLRTELGRCAALRAVDFSAPVVAPQVMRAYDIARRTRGGRLPRDTWITKN